MSGMNGVFAKRRARLLAMKALRERYVSHENGVSCPKCGNERQRAAVAQALFFCP